jgi:hypothetical protein
MLEGSGSGGWLEWAAGVATVFAVVVPFFFAVYGLLAKPTDKRLTWVGLATATLVALSWLLGTEQQESVEGELETVREELALAQADPDRRTFEEAEREILVERLSELRGPSAFVLANASDPDTALYAREIVAILKEAGWEVPPSFGMIFSPVVLPGQEGVANGIVLGVSPTAPEDVGGLLLSAFQKAGADITLGPHWPGTEHPISILVGPKAGL